MANQIDVKVPDIGDFTDVPVIEIFVKPGDSVEPGALLARIDGRVPHQPAFAS